ncbi:probable ATP-dependent RNA helicase Dbp73D [Drosophila takahashii]|uniref:probable ATP-dependent RNA helicase Dbp73D n=1 Tax=Drosophila takahashii TaxID=29030 RepID=UPI001CF875CA|nr:probable ATP-dependent RNA helicase Dbp73D [Drosophila takahashii]
MELFTVNRYTEDLKKPKDGIQDTANNEDEILQKLLQKAAKRKRKHKEIEVTEAPVTENVVPEETEIKSTEEQKEELEKPQEIDEEPLPSNEFQVLGGDGSAAKKKKVEMQLPSWLAHPTIIEGGILQPEEEIPASEAIDQLEYLEKTTCMALKQMKIKRLFPVQRQVIPWILEAHAKPAPFRPRDICVSAPTGSGKTLAFAIPIVQLLKQRVECKVRALVVLPVAELALQVFRVISTLCSKTELEVCLLSKQHKLEDEQEKLVELYKGKYYSKVDIVVTTPGRLVDHLHATKGFCLKNLKFLIIDEADRIMDAVFQNWLYHLDSHVKETTDQLLAGTQAPLCYAELQSSFGKQPHKLLFSATLSQDPEKLQNLRLFQPRLFTTVFTMPVIKAVTDDVADLEANQDQGQFVGKYTTPAELTEQFCVTELRLKPLTLFALVEKYQWKRFLCFTNSTDQASRLTFVMKSLFQGTSTTVAELSGNLSALVRKQALKEFAAGKINGLICSDALARGIDVADIDVVLSYEVPRHIKTHIHRVGRTARAGRKGTAVTLLTEQDQAAFKKIVNDVGKGLGEEIHVSPDIEIQHAVNYKKALDHLRVWQQKEKAQKAVQKKRVATQALVHKKQEATATDRPLTVMEKLQLKAGVAQTEGLAKPQSKNPNANKSKAQPKETKKQRIAKKRKDIEN